MKLVSWNVAGFRACLKKGFTDFFNNIDADVFCLQETKMLKEQLEVPIADYHQYWNSADKLGYSGTLILTKEKPIDVFYGLDYEEFDHEGRVITLEYDHFYLVTVYTPNVKRDLSRLDYRMKWEDIFKDYLKSLEKTKPVIVCGDLNVAHQEIDIKNSKANIGNAGFTYEERNKFTDLLNNGFIDTFRFLYPDKTNAYTWWSYMGKARENNIGWRIDYFLVSNVLKDKIKTVNIYDDILGSDHCPIGLNIF